MEHFEAADSFSSKLSKYGIFPGAWLIIHAGREEGSPLDEDPGIGRVKVSIGNNGGGQNAKSSLVGHCQRCWIGDKTQRGG